MTLKLLFLRLIFCLSILSVLSSCVDRNNDLDEDATKTYTIEMSYSGDLINWSDSLKISTIVNSNSIPTLSGSPIEKIEKISETQYNFILPTISPQNKTINTSDNIKEINISGLLIPINNDATDIEVLIKIYKNNIYSEQFSFQFTKNSPYRYYNLNVK